MLAGWEGQVVAPGGALGEEAGRQPPEQGSVKEGLSMSWELRGPLGEAGPSPPFLTPAPLKLRHTQRSTCSQECSPGAQVHWAGAAALSPLRQDR